MAESGTRVAFGPVKLGADALVGFLGLSLSAASFLALFAFGPELVVPLEGRGPLARLACAVALVVTFLVVWAAAQRLAAGRFRVLAGASCIGVVAFGAALFVPAAGFTSALALLMLAACGWGALSTLWFCFVCTRPTRVIPLFVAAAIGAGVLACLVESWLVPEAMRVSVVALWALSAACLLALLRKWPESTVSNSVANKDSDKRSKILWTSALMLSISNFEFGVVLVAAPAAGATALCLAAAALTSALLAVGFVRRRPISERTVSPITPPLTIFAFVSLYLFGPTVHLVSLCVLSALFTVYSSFGLAAIAEHVRISRLSPTRASGKARLIDFAGMALGVACGGVVVRLASAQPMAAAQMTAVLALVYGFVAAYCHKARFPEEGMEDGRAHAPEAKGLWKKRCRAVSDQCDLSERQFEVLMLVAQGRNAKYIEQALSISLSTAQTHIRNIYRKTGVHSRQELLNLIEDTKLYGEE